jgi:hypothetical protein
MFRTYLDYQSNVADGNPDSDYLELGIDMLESGLGLVYSSAEFYSESLHGAIIDSVKYGNIIVNIEDNPNIENTNYPTITSLYPNPFNSTLSVKYVLPKTAQINISIYNLTGQCILTLINEHKPPGYYQIYWNGKDNTGNYVSSGLYFIIIKNENFQATHKVIFIK